MGEKTENLQDFYYRKSACLNQSDETQLMQEKDKSQSDWCGQKSDMMMNIQYRMARQPPTPTFFLEQISKINDGQLMTQETEMKTPDQRKKSRCSR